MKLKLRMTPPLCVLLIVLLAANLALAADGEFNGVVSAIESHYGVRHMHIPLLGFALFFVRPEGISGLKLAVFEDFHRHAHDGYANDDVRDVVEHHLGPDWRLFVHTYSRAGGENTLIYTKFSGGKMQMLVVSLESDEATLVQMNLNERAIQRWMRDPGDHAKNDWSHNQHNDD
jgi:hypothetical protein